jgi:hypothetical protein
MGSEIVYYTVSVNCGDFFISANFVGDSESLPPGTDLPASILKSIRPKEVEAVPSDGHKPSSSAPTTSSNTPADSH